MRDCEGFHLQAIKRALRTALRATASPSYSDFLDNQASLQSHPTWSAAVQVTADQ